MQKKPDMRHSLKHLSETGLKKNVQLVLQKEQYIKICHEPVANYYKIYNNLGEGSYGKVKKVYHLKLGEFRAMKIVNKKLHSSHNEIEILRKISHPNIVNIFEIFEDKTKYYIMSEYCEGGELFTAIAEKGFFNEFEASRIIKQILQAINYLHSNSIVHRDLKPENIMFMSNFKDIKLIDFGTAIELPKRKKLTKLIGTSYYLAPEVIAENYDEKCDVWSCGIILYILLCGYPPFNGVSNNDIYNAIRYSKLNFNQNNWSNISKEAITLITKMLEKNPKKRISAEEGLNDFWFKKVSFNRKQTIGINQFEILERMALFVQQNKFKQAVLQFISTQFNLKKEEEELKQVFKHFDNDGSGLISKKEFIEQIENLYGGIISEEILNHFFSSLDLDNSGTISYNEFLTSVIDSQKILTEDRLNKAFKMFDKDGSGTLEIGEIKQFFGGNDKTWKRVLKEIDENEDGCIDFQEFKKMMVGFSADEIVCDKTMGKEDTDKQIDGEDEE
jgi:calcium-dependent protein kinase